MGIPGQPETQRQAHGEAAGYRDRATQRQHHDDSLLKRPDEVNDTTEQARTLFVRQDTATGIDQPCISEQVRRDAVVRRNILRAYDSGHSDVLAFVVDNDFFTTLNK